MYIYIYVCIYICIYIYIYYILFRLYSNVCAKNTMCVIHTVRIIKFNIQSNLTMLKKYNVQVVCVDIHFGNIGHKDAH